MRYTKVKVSFRFAPSRLYRVLLVPENTDLLRFAQIIGDSFHVAWEHLFQFRKGNTNYVLDAENDFGGIFSNAIDETMQNFDIGVLGQKAVFEYDFGDGWEFDVRIYKPIVERDEEKAAWILEGAGQGIWEDYIGSLYAYLDGRVDDDFVEEEDSEYGLPWNFDNKHFSDFDKPLNLEAEQKYLDERLKQRILPDNSEEDAEDEDDDAVMENLLELTEGLDRLGADRVLHKWASQTLVKLRKQYGEPQATLLVFRMLMEEQEQVLGMAQDDEPF